MKIINKVLSAFIATTMTASVCISTIGSLGTAVAADKSAIDLVEDMGMGWNLGNTFDCWNVKSYTTDIETAWGNPKTTQAMIDGIKSAGFNSVRIPITWEEKTNATTFDIDDAYLARIKEVVDYCRANDMYVIINTHWDFSGDGTTSWLTKGLAAKTQFTTMWNEIANYFKDYDEHLVFEGMNEVTFAYDVLQQMNQAFIDTVRATGGNNADRLLLIAGKNADPTDTCSSNYKMPTDPADMLAVSIHYYTPPQWCVAEPGTSWGYYDTWGTDADVKAVYDDFNKMKNAFVDKGIPVIIGEYGVLSEDKSGKNKDDIAKYLNTVASAGLNVEGISTFLWDTSGAGDMNFFNRKTLTWFDDTIKNNYEKLAQGDVTIPDGLALTDRITYNADQMEALKGGGYNIDLKPYKGLANLVNVVVEGTVSTAGTAEAYGVGGGIAFSAKQNGAAVGGYTAESWFLNAGDTSNVVDIDGLIENTDDDGNITSIDTYEMEYDYLNIVKWWDWSDPSGETVNYTIDKVTLIFDTKIYVDATTGLVIPTEPSSTEEEIEWGDANCDGDVDMGDAVAILKYLADPVGCALTEQGKLNGDVHKNGNKLDASDALSIQKLRAKQLTELPESYLEK